MTNLRFLIITVLLLFLTGCTIGKKQNEITSGWESNRKQAETVLISFFNNLAADQYEEAVAKFAPEAADPTAWQWLEGFGEDSTESRATALKNYCAAVGTCLPVKIISVKNEGENFIFQVNFIKKDGGIFVLGPCCGATAEEMPPVKEFDYLVKKIGDHYKVITPPQYVP